MKKMELRISISLADESLEDEEQIQAAIASTHHLETIERFAKIFMLLKIRDLFSIIISKKT
jgi:hypothetical protein